MLGKWLLIRSVIFKAHTKSLMSCSTDTNSHMTCSIVYRKLLREKTFANFKALWLSTNIFSIKFGGVVSFGMAQVNNLHKFSPQKSIFTPIHESFLPRKFPTIKTTAFYKLCAAARLPLDSHTFTWSVMYMILYVCTPPMISPTGHFLSILDS